MGFLNSLHFIAQIAMCYSQICSDSGKRLIRSSEIDRIVINTCNGVVINGSEYIEGFLASCTFTDVLVSSFGDCYAECNMNSQCKAVKYVDTNDCNICLSNSIANTEDIAIPNSLFIELNMLGLYIDGRYKTWKYLYTLF